MRLAVAGLDAGDLRPADGDTVPIRVTLGETNRLDALPRLAIPTVTGGTARFSEVADLDRVTSPTAIDHHGAKQRAVTVRADVRTGFNTDRVTRAALERVAALDLPAGVRWVAAGEIESRQESFGG